MNKFAAPKGVSEYFPDRSKYFEFVRETLIDSARRSGYQLIELPVFEDTELFARGVGESTDVVSKEMYTFEDRGGRSITLRPEGTAGVMRSVIEHNLDRGQLPVKVWYSGQFFRAERPQLGRYRQFYQVGIEAIGLQDPEIDAEVISVADRAFKKLGLKNYSLEITSLGDAPTRERYTKDLRTYIATLDLDEATTQRANLNPLRLFDDKRDEVRALMAGAPVLMDYLTQESASHFQKVQECLNDFSIDYSINKRMVRGLDYYTGTAFEFVHNGLGSQSGIGGGGRYDGLGARFGRARAAVGGAVTLELLHHAVGGPEGLEPAGVVVVGGLDDRVTAAAMLRATGVPVVAVPAKQRDVEAFAVADGRRFVARPVKAGWRVVDVIDGTTTTVASLEEGPWT